MKSDKVENKLLSVIFITILLANSSCSTVQQANTGKRGVESPASETGILGRIAITSLYSSKSQGKITNLSDSISGKVNCISANNSGSPPNGWDGFVDNLKNQGLIDKSTDGIAPLSEQNRIEAWQLIASGGAENDARRTITSLISTMTKNDSTRLRDQLGNIADARHGLGLMGSLFNDLSSIDNQGNLNHTLKFIENEPLTEVVSETARIFTQKDNRSTRLAIIAYAHMNGINISEENLDDLNSALDKNNASLDPLLKGAIEILKQEYGFGDTQQVLDKFNNFKGSC